MPITNPNLLTKTPQCLASTHMTLVMSNRPGNFNAIFGRLAFETPFLAGLL